MIDRAMLLKKIEIFKGVCMNLATGVPTTYEQYEQATEDRNA